MILIEYGFQHSISRSQEVSKQSIPGTMKSINQHHTLTNKFIFNKIEKKGKQLMFEYVSKIHTCLHIFLFIFWLEKNRKNYVLVH